MSESTTVTVRTRNSASMIMGTIALVLGVLAALVAWIPFLGVVAIPVALVGGLLAAIGAFVALIKGFQGMVLPLVAGVVCVGAIVLAWVVTGKSADAWTESTRRARAEATAAPKPVDDPELRAYIDEHLEIYDVEARYRDTYLDERVPGLTFKIRNGGDRTLRRVGVVFYFLDAEGNRIAEEDFNPVLVTNYSSGSKPLRPGYVWSLDRGKFYKASSVPDEWKEGSVEVEVTAIAFADEARADPEESGSGS